MVYRTDTHQCEAPDARSGRGEETCTGPRPACPPGQGVWCDFDDATFKCATDGSSTGGGGGGARRPPGGQSGLSDQEKEMYAAITALAKLLSGQGESLFNVGFPAYTEAINYYRILLGKGGRSAAQAAVAPSAEGIAQAYEGAKTSVGTGYLRGGAKDAAIADLTRAQSGDTARLVAGVQPGAASALVGAGLAGTQAGQQGEAAGASAYGGLLATQVQDRQFQTTLREQIRQFDVSIATQVDLANKARAAGLEAAAMQADLARQQLEEQKRQFEAQLAFQQQQARTQQQQYSSQQKTGTGLAIGQLLVGLVVGLGTKNPATGAAAAGAVGAGSTAGTKGRGCFITTVVCQGLGKSDNCWELQTLRAFRDEYILHLSDGKERMEEYYRIAPEIADRLKGEGQERMEEIYNVFLLPAIKLIQQGDNEAAMSVYVAMVDSLEKR